MLISEEIKSNFIFADIVSHTFYLLCYEYKYSSHYNKYKDKEKEFAIGFIDVFRNCYSQ